MRRIVPRTRSRRTLKFGIDVRVVADEAGDEVDHRQRRSNGVETSADGLNNRMRHGLFTSLRERVRRECESAAQVLYSSPAIAERTPR